MVTEQSFYSVWANMKDSDWQTPLPEFIQIFKPLQKYALKWPAEELSYY